MRDRLSLFAVSLAETSSMLLGFQYVALVAVVFYAASWVSLRSLKSEVEVL